MAACKGVVNRIITKHFTNLSVSSWLLRNNKPLFLFKGQYPTNRRPLSVSSNARKSNEKSRICSQNKKYKHTVYTSERHYCTAKIRELDELTFHTIADETLDVLLENFEELGDIGYFDQDYDIEYSDGVLTVRLGGNHGTYVINKQTPNRQLWLSSPTSGPKRYDFTESDCWIYRHTGISLHKLLSDEISNVIGQSVSFTDLSYGDETNS